MKSALNSLDCQSRRQFVERTAKAAFGLSLMPFTDQVMAQNIPEGKKAKHIIYMFMSGGMPHLDTSVPHRRPLSRCHQ